MMPPENDKLEIKATKVPSFLVSWKFWTILFTAGSTVYGAVQAKVAYVDSIQKQIVVMKEDEAKERKSLRQDILYIAMMQAFEIGKPTESERTTWGDELVNGTLDLRKLYSWAQKKREDREAAITH